jgi:hypothetical protein
MPTNLLVADAGKALTLKADATGYELTKLVKKASELSDFPVFNASKKDYVLSIDASGNLIFKSIAPTGPQLPTGTTGNAGKVVMVNAGGTDYELVTPLKKFAELSDVQALAGQAGKVLQINTGSNGIEYVTPIRKSIDL